MIHAFAPAKINLALHVTGRRDDGYHLLDSLVVFADIGDRLTFDRAEKRRLTVTGPFAQGVPEGPENLIWQAADLLDPQGAAAITLEKNLPHGAGIGSGSSDAAASLQGLADLWGLEPPGPAGALPLGADVPVCLNARPVRMRGIGERLDRVPPVPPIWLALVNPKVTVPTAQVFSALTERDNAGLAPCDWRDDATFLNWLSRHRNDLEAPARGIAPQIDDCLGALRAQEGCHLARMSGSGATCFGVFDADRAQDAARDIGQTHPDWWVAAAPLLS